MTTDEAGHRAVSPDEVFGRPKVASSTRVGSGPHARKVSWWAWGDETRPTVVLVHGGAAHAWWWAQAAVELSDEFHVMAMDLSGHGASDWRDDYTYEGWIEEILTVALSDDRVRPVVVGHSLGGIIASAMAGHPDAARLAGIIVVDAPVVALDGESHLRAEHQLGIPRSYPDRESAVAAFQLRPPQAVVEEEFFDFVAGRSVHREGASWTWRYDPGVFSGWPDRPTTTVSQLRDAPCPVTMVVGEVSPIMTPANLAAMDALVDGSSGNLRLEVLPGAAHHLMFDAAQGLAGIIRKCATEWTSLDKRVADPGNPE